MESSISSQPLNGINWTAEEAFKWMRLVGDHTALEIIYDRKDNITETSDLEDSKTPKLARELHSDELASRSLRISNLGRGVKEAHIKKLFRNYPTCVSS